MSGIGPIGAPIPASLTATLASDYRSAVMALSPVGYYRLNERDGTIVKDECRSSVGATAASPTLGTVGLVVGDANTAMTFAAASSQYIGLGATAALNFVNDWSVVLLVKTSTVSTTMVSRRDNNGSRGFFIGYSVGIHSDGKLNVVSSNAGASGGSSAMSANSIADGATHFVAVTRTGTSLLGYVDALAAVAGNAASGACGTGDMITEIGALNYNGRSAFMNDVLDEVAIFNKVLTPAQIANLQLVSVGR